MPVIVTVSCTLKSYQLQNSECDTWQLLQSHFINFNDNTLKRRNVVSRKLRGTDLGVNLPTIYIPDIISLPRRIDLGRPAIFYDLPRCSDPIISTVERPV